MKKLFYILPLLGMLFATLGCEEGTVDHTGEKWDGKIASNYANGWGTKRKPYIIKTGGQLLYALKQGTGYLKLDNDIDLDNQQWTPYDFQGTLDGAGHTISNLYIDCADENECGLIGTLWGTVQNLTIRGVNIVGGNNVGAIAGSGGYVRYHEGEDGIFTNCHVVLLNDSRISGVESVGGIVGWISSGSCTSCIVEAAEDGAYIFGERYVGGIIGQGGVNNQTYGSRWTDIHVDDCHASGYILGEKSVGGIAGYRIIPSKCSFAGTIEGADEVGGIMGATYDPNGIDITECKVVADIVGNGGGICGYTYGWGTKNFICCYTDGRAGGMIVGHASGGDVNIIHSYSTISSTFAWVNAENSYDAKFYVIDSYSIHNSNNIAQTMKDAYSDYADYWNFDNTWTWTGTVGGKAKNVKCPRLAWE